jgi:acyl-CoA reductase-like NAD-dependent aldehyde dehydrogenase
MIYSLNGERCTSSSRALVERSIYDDAFARQAPPSASRSLQASAIRSMPRPRSAR